LPFWFELVVKILVGKLDYWNIYSIEIVLSLSPKYHQTDLLLTVCFKLWEESYLSIGSTRGTALKRFDLEGHTFLFHTLFL
jgi:hypothetical protein